MNSWASVEDLIAELSGLPNGGRTITHLVMHHTWQPDHASFSGAASVESMVGYWKGRQEREGWQYPPGGHFVVDPAGGIYQPFGLEVPLNADSNLAVNRSGIAVETVGDFDIGHDPFRDPQRHAAIGLFAALCVRFGLTEAQVWFHRDFTNEKSCPGTGLDRRAFRAEVAAAIPWVKRISTISSDATGNE